MRGWMLRLWPEGRLMRKFEAQGLAVHLVIAERIRWVINRR
jgi:hypothetical protein